MKIFTPNTVIKSSEVNQNFTDIGNALPALNTFDSGWHNVGGLNEPAFQNGWSNYDTNWQVARFKKLSNGLVMIQGLIHSGTVGATIFTLPVGYRPTKPLIVDAVSYSTGYTVGRVDVNVDGTVYMNAGGNNFTSLSNIIFLAEQ